MGLALVLAGACSRSPATKVAAPVPVLTAKAVTQTVPVRIEPAPVGHVTPILSVVPAALPSGHEAPGPAAIRVEQGGAAARPLEPPLASSAASK